MSDRYYPVELTVPASTAPGNPTVLKVPLEDNTLVDVEIIVPAGHVALTGVRVLSSNQQIIPWGNLSWIKANDYVRVFEYNDQIAATAISVNGYNTDVIAHTFYLRFHIRDRISPDSGSPSGLIGGTGVIVGTGTGGTGLPVGVPISGPPPPITPPPPIGVPAPPGIGGGGTPGSNALQQAYFLLI